MYRGLPIHFGQGWVDHCKCLAWFSIYDERVSWWSAGAISTRILWGCQDGWCIEVSMLPKVSLPMVTKLSIPLVCFLLRLTSITLEIYI